MGDFFAEDPAMTVDKCHALALANDYPYFAVQAGTYCFATDSDKNPITYGPSKGCNTPCPGNKKQTCGGCMTNSLYLTNTPGGGSCTVNDQTGPPTYTSSVMTVGLCAVIAANTKTPYFGVKARTQCLAGGSSLIRQPASDNCYKNCAGDSDQTCGGANAATTYSSYGLKCTTDSCKCDDGSSSTPRTLATSVTNCGYCGNVCTGVGGAAPKCVGGNCM